MNTWIVLDVHYLCHRAFHSTQKMRYQDKPTGVIFGFLKSLTHIKDELMSDKVAFCFEHPKLYRRDVYPPYKRKRAKIERTPEEKKAYEGLVLQISELQRRYLPKIGFKNIFSFRGMESDDTMAEIARYHKQWHDIVIVTADQDLYQCLDDGVSIWSPQKRKLLTKEWFISEYGIEPHQWAVVKAIAGCTSDEVEGIKGVGDLTALRYLRGELKPGSRGFKAIRSYEGRAIVRRNRPLVELPYKGCPTPNLVHDEVSRSGWAEVCGMLGMRSIAGHPPIATRRRQ